MRSANVAVHVLKRAHTVLACRCRLAASAGAELGMTDLKLGLPPVAGGAVRLARLLGGPAAQALLMAAQPMAPAQALKRGLVDELVPSADLIAAAKRRVLENSPPSHDKSGDSVTVRGAAINQPAPRAISETLNESLGTSMDAALEGKLQWAS